VIVMPRRAYYPFAHVGRETKRYAGNRDATRMEVHDLDNETWQCQIDNLWHAHVVMFDKVEEALKEGFKRCPHCLPAAKAEVPQASRAL